MSWLDSNFGPATVKRDTVELPKRARFRIEGADSTTLFDDPSSGETVLDLSVIISGASGQGALVLFDGSLNVGDVVTSALDPNNPTKVRIATSQNLVDGFTIRGVVAVAPSGGRVTIALPGAALPPSISGLSTSGIVIVDEDGGLLVTDHPQNGANMVGWSDSVGNLHVLPGKSGQRYFNIADYGAVKAPQAQAGDCIDAFEAAIAAAKNYTTTTGKIGTVFVPDCGGGYFWDVTRPIDIPTGVGLLGESQDGSSIRSVFGGGPIVYVMPDSNPGLVRSSPSLVDGATGKRAIMSESSPECDRFNLTTLHMAKLDGLTTWTFEGWGKMTTGGGGVRSAVFLESSAPKQLSSDTDAPCAIQIACFNDGVHWQMFVKLTTQEDGPVQFNSGSGVDDFVADTTFHWAVSCDSSGNVRAFVNGVAKGSHAFGGARHLRQTNQEEMILNCGGGGVLTARFDQDIGWRGVDEIDCFRFSNSARYTAAFTPTTTKFTTDVNTYMLMTFEDDQQVGRFSGCRILGYQAWIPLTTRGQVGNTSVTISNLNLNEGNFGNTGLQVRGGSSGTFSSITSRARQAFQFNSGTFGSRFRDLVAASIGTPRYGFMFAAGGPCEVSKCQADNASGAYGMIFALGGYSVDTVFLGGNVADGGGVHLFICGNDTNVDARVVGTSDEGTFGGQVANIAIVQAGVVSLHTPTMDVIEEPDAMPIVIDGGKSITLDCPQFNAASNTNSGCITVIQSPDRLEVLHPTILVGTTIPVFATGNDALPPKEVWTDSYRFGSSPDSLGLRGGVFDGTTTSSTTADQVVATIDLPSGKSWTLTVKVTERVGNTQTECALVLQTFHWNGSAHSVAGQANGYPTDLSTNTLTPKLTLSSSTVSVKVTPVSASSATHKIAYELQVA